MKKTPRPAIEFIPLSTDAGKIRFFGALMPALLLLKASPLKFLRYQLAGRRTPRKSLAELIASNADDAARVGNTLIFVHRWHSAQFDPFTFARARTFLKWVARSVERQGFHSQTLDALSPDVNLPRLAASAGLGNLSPYGLLVHPIFGPRLILTALITNCPIQISPRWGGDGCEDCMACVKLCPQNPLQGGVVNLGQCQSCAKCLVVCPTGKGRRARAELLKLDQTTEVL